MKYLSVVGWVVERATIGTEGAPGVLTPQDRLERWASLAQPPLRKGRRVMPWSSCMGFIVGSGFIGGGLLGASFAVNDMGLSAIWAIVPFLFALSGVFVVIYSFWMVFQGLRGGTSPVAAVILDREARENSLLIHVHTLPGKRLKLSPVTKSAREAYPGDLGWAYIRGRLLLEFVSASKNN